jgi:hypothetical protein
MRTKTIIKYLLAVVLVCIFYLVHLWQTAKPRVLYKSVDDRGYISVEYVLHGDTLALDYLDSVEYKQFLNGYFPF